MALQALKEAKIPVARCRLTPPSSPSKRFSAQARSRPARRSRVLAALDAAEFDAFGNVRQPALVLPPAAGKRTAKSSGSCKFSAVAQPANPFAADVGATPPTDASSMPSAESQEKEVIDIEFESDAIEEELLPEEPEAATVPIDPALYPQYTSKDFGNGPVVVYTRHEEETNDLVECLRQPLGFDMEWRFFYRRREGPEGKTVLLERPTAVIQLCDPQMILVIHISAMKTFPAKLKAVLENEFVWKCGVNIRNDGMKLYRDFGVLPRRLAELGAMAHHADRNFSQFYKRKIVSLQKMVGMYLQKNVVKPPLRTGNWEAIPLSKDQIEYAANDAHASLMVFRQLRKIAVKQRRHIERDVPEYTVDLWKELHAGTLEKDEIGETASVHTAALPPEGLNTEPGSAPKVSFEWQRRRRAYNMWYEGKLSLNEMSLTFNRGSAHVIRYILRALEADKSLPYDFDKLTELVNQNPKARKYFKDWCKRMIPAQK